MERTWSIGYPEDPDALYVSLIAGICSSIRNWKIIRGNESLRSLLLSPRIDNETNENARILGSEIEIRILSTDGKSSTLQVTLRFLDPSLTNESREVISKTYPINLLLSIGKTDKLIIDELDLQNTLKALGPVISKTVLSHLANQGYFKNKNEPLDTLFRVLTELYGPAADVIIENIRNGKMIEKDGVMTPTYSRMFTFCSLLPGDKLYDKLNQTLGEIPEFHFNSEAKITGKMKVSFTKTEGSAILECRIIPRTIEGSRAEFILTETRDSGELREISHSSTVVHKFINRLFESI